MRSSSHSIPRAHAALDSRCPSEDRGDENAAGLRDSPGSEQPRRPVGEMREDRDGADEIGVIAIREAGLRIIDVHADGFRKVVAQPADARLMNVAAGELSPSSAWGRNQPRRSVSRSRSRGQSFRTEFQSGVNRAKTNAWTSRPISSNRWRRARRRRSG